MYDAWTFVVSSRRGFCVGGLPVDIWAVSNVEVYGRHIKGEICEVFVRYGSCHFRIFQIGIRLLCHMARVSSWAVFIVR